MNRSDNIGVVVLAAGSSSRLGKPKQLVRLQGKPLLQQVIDQCELQDFTSKVIALGANTEIIKKALNPGAFTLVMNENWKEGIASSIRKGVEISLDLNPAMEHLLILLSDQPFVSAELLNQLIEKHLSGMGEITASFYDDDVGVPAIFSKDMFPLLMKLNGDQGAKKIMKRFPDQVTRVHFEMGHFDVDTPQDHAELLKLESKSDIKQMQIKVKYFGAIAEKTGTAAEVLTIEEPGFEVEELRTFCIQKYGLEDDDSIRIAVNQLVKKKGILQNGDEVAFLPPYAGG